MWFYLNILSYFECIIAQMYNIILMEMIDTFSVQNSNTKYIKLKDGVFFIIIIYIL